MNLLSYHDSKSKLVVEVRTKHEGCNSIPFVEFPVFQAQQSVSYYDDAYAKFAVRPCLCIH